MSLMPPSTTFDYQELQRLLGKAHGDDELFKSIVNVPFQFRLQTVNMYLGIIVLLQCNPVSGTIDRIALSNTDLAHDTTRVSAKPFTDIKIASDYHENIIVQAIAANAPQHTADWQYLFIPALTPEDARINQASAGIASSTVYPLTARNGGALIFSYYQYPRYIGEAHETFMATYTALVNNALRTEHH